MNKLSRMAIASLALATVSAPASAFLEDWKLDVDGAGGSGPATVNEYLDFIGNSFIQNTFVGYPPGIPPAGTAFTFTDNGVYAVDRVDGGQTIPDLFPGYEMTAIFSGGTGSGVLGGDIAFNPGGTLTFYSDNNTTTRYGTAAGIYGANNGTAMGNFTLVSGSGAINPIGLPNGEISLTFEAAGTSLTCGYWFDPAGNDLCGTDTTIGFVTTNASLVANANLLLRQEVVCQQSGFDCPNGNSYNNAPFNFLVSNNGQYRLQTPEPGTIALLGLGLAGLGLRRRLHRA